jgi:hypothetical protein
MDADLIDGANARWMWPVQRAGGSIYCGWINAPNRMGGYTGWQPFGVVFAGNRSNDVESASIIEDPRRGSMAILCEAAGYEIFSPPRR